MSEKLSRKSPMSRVINWQSEIELIAGPYDGNRKGWLSRAARVSGATYRQIKGLWYGEISDPKHSVATSILTAADKARIKEAASDANTVASFFDSHAQALANVDADFHREQIDAFREVARVIGSRNSA